VTTRGFSNKAEALTFIEAARSRALKASQV
jgi:hypothetical protein